MSAFRLHKQVVQRLVSTGLAGLTLFSIIRQYSVQKMHGATTPRPYLSSWRGASFAVPQLFFCPFMLSFPTQSTESKHRPLNSLKYERRCMQDSAPYSSRAETALFGLKVSRISPLVLLRRAVLRRTWMWDIGRMTETGESRRKTCVSATLYTTNPTLTGAGLKQHFRGAGGTLRHEFPVIIM